MSLIFFFQLIHPFLHHFEQNRTFFRTLLLPTSEQILLLSNYATEEPQHRVKQLLHQKTFLSRLDIGQPNHFFPSAYINSISGVENFTNITFECFGTLIYRWIEPTFQIFIIILVIALGNIFNGLAVWLTIWVKQWVFIQRFSAFSQDLVSQLCLLLQWCDLFVHCLAWFWLYPFLYLVFFIFNQVHHLWLLWQPNLVREIFHWLATSDLTQRLVVIRCCKSEFITFIHWIILNLYFSSQELHVLAEHHEFYPAIHDQRDSFPAAD